MPDVSTDLSLSRNITSNYLTHLFPFSLVSSPTWFHRQITSADEVNILDSCHLKAVYLIN